MSSNEQLRQSNKYTQIYEILSKLEKGEQKKCEHLGVLPCSYKINFVKEEYRS